LTIDKKNVIASAKRLNFSLFKHIIMATFFTSLCVNLIGVIITLEHFI